MKILFAGTPDFSATILQAILKATSLNVVGCLSQPDKPKGRGRVLASSPVKTLALQHDLPILTPISLKNSEIQQKIQALSPDIMIVVAYGLIIPQEILDIPTFGCINIHASILPKWRGASPIQSAILHGDQQSGITIMQMDAGLDTGDILSTYPCTISTQDTSADLYNKLSKIGEHAILDTLEKIQAKQITPIQQDNSQASYAPKIKKEHANIDWHKPAIEIERSIRAYQPWPIAYSYLDGKNIRIWQAKIMQDSSSSAPGTICTINSQGIDVTTGDKLLRLTKVQIPGKKPVQVSDILNAKHPFIVDHIFTRNL